MNDWQLLERYAHERDDEAFAELVRRHMDVVYTTARRAAGNHAEDVAQAVFMLLAQKAKSLRPTGSLVGWLYGATRLCCSNLRKIERHRAQRERAAAVPEVRTMNVESTEELAYLDAALAALDGREREAVLLRYFEQASFGDVGAALGVTEEAARKRSERGLEKLRKFFKRHGVVLALAAVAALAKNAMAGGAPTGLAHSTLAVVKGGASVGVAGEVVEAVRRGWRRRWLAKVGVMGMGTVVVAALLVMVWPVPAREGGVAVAKGGGTGSTGPAGMMTPARGVSQGLVVGSRSVTPVNAGSRGGPAGSTLAGVPGRGGTGTSTGTSTAGVPDYILGTGLVSGRLVDGQRRPVSNVDLTYTRRIPGTIRGRASLTDIMTTVQTDANGEFTLTELGFIQGHPELAPPVMVRAMSARQGEFSFDLTFELRDKTDIRLKADVVMQNSAWIRISDPNVAGVDIREEMYRARGPDGVTVIWSPPSTGRGR